MVWRMNPGCLRSLGRELDERRVYHVEDLPLDSELRAELEGISAIDRARVQGYALALRDHRDELDSLIGACWSPDGEAGDVRVHDVPSTPDENVRFARNFALSFLAVCAIVVACSYIGNANVAAAVNQADPVEVWR